MYFFDKKVVYLVWKMQEGQARGVGTVKLLAMDEVCRMEISITGCGRVQGTYPVYAISGDLKSLLGEITLNKGKGNLYLKCKTNAIGHMAFPYGQVTGMHIDLKTEGCMEQKWLPLQKEGEIRVEPEPVVEEMQKSTPNAEKEPNVEKLPSKEPDRIEVPSKEPEPVVGKKVPPTKEPKTDVPPKPPEKDSFRLYPNKWRQLCAIYPIVHPFGDGRAYLSIEPRDFVVLQERFQPMVQNSFLLHGFYHYRHLLLGRQRQGRNFQYFLGVPGVFYEKEKEAALFYGFESFEGATTPATEGSFGYYMKRVLL